MIVPTKPQNSIRVCQSRPLRARRDTSMAKTDPTRPSQIAASRRSTGPAGAGSRPAKIVVNHQDVLPAQVSRTICKTILTAAALVVVQQLIRRRLTNVDIGRAGQVLRRYRRHSASPRPPSPWKPRSALPGAAAASGSSELAIVSSAAPPPRTDLLADGSR